MTGPDPRRGAFGLAPLPGSAALGTGEFVYRQMLDAVLSQRLRPGVRLREQALSEIFGTGRSTIRAVLQRLAHDGIVDLKANRGARVDRPSPGEAVDLLEARRVIEGELAARTAARARAADITPTDVEPLRAMAREEAVHARAARRGAALRLACDFHLALARLGGNASLAAALERQVLRTALAVGAFERPGRELPGARSRAELIDVVLGGDGRAARRAVRTHLDALEASLDLSGGAPAGELRDAFAQPGGDAEG